MRDLTTRQLWNAVSGVLADSKDERAEEATRAVDELRRRCDVAGALLAAIVEIARHHVEWDGGLLTADGEDISLMGWLLLLRNNPTALARIVPSTKPIIESALAQRGVGLEELE